MHGPKHESDFRHTAKHLTPTIQWRPKFAITSPTVQTEIYHSLGHICWFRVGYSRPTAKVPTAVKEWLRAVEILRKHRADPTSL